MCVYRLSEKKNLRSTGIFFFLSRNHTFTVICMVHTYIFYIMVYRKRALRKTPCVPNHICYASAILEERLHHLKYFWHYRSDRSFRRILQPEKRLRDERYKQHSAKLTNVRAFAPPMLFNVQTRRQCQPLTFRL